MDGWIQRCGIQSLGNNTSLPPPSTWLRPRNLPATCSIQVGSDRAVVPLVLFLCFTPVEICTWYENHLVLHSNPKGEKKEERKKDGSPNAWAVCTAWQDVRINATLSLSNLDDINLFLNWDLREIQDASDGQTERQFEIFIDVLDNTTYDHHIQSSNECLVKANKGSYFISSIEVESTERFVQPKWSSKLFCLIWLLS